MSRGPKKPGWDTQVQCIRRENEMLRPENERLRAENVRLTDEINALQRKIDDLRGPLDIPLGELMRRVGIGDGSPGIGKEDHDEGTAGTPGHPTGG